MEKRCGGEEVEGEVVVVVVATPALFTGCHVRKGSLTWQVNN